MTFNRQQRAFIFKGFAFLCSIGLLIFLAIALKKLIFPMIVGALLAYLCRPLLNLFRYHWLPEGIRLFILMVSFVGFLFVATWVVRSNLPNEAELLELSTRIQYKLNEKSAQYFEISKPKNEKSFISKVLEEQFAPFVQDLNHFVSLNEAQEKQFLGYYQRGLILEKYYQYFLKNKDYKESDSKREVSSTLVDGNKKAFQLSRIMGVFEVWIITPLVFLFMLFDKGNFSRYWVRLIPNRYFELTLTVFEQVNLAIGKYLRGTLLECLCVGLSMFLGLFLIGIDLQAAFLIAMIAGLANAIPFLGTAVGLVVGVAYAMIAEDVSPILPFLKQDDLLIAVIAVMTIVHFLDNAVFQPMIVGHAVNLHPVIVILGILGGSLMFGFSGVLLAIPTIVVVKVFIETLSKGLKDYQII